MKDGFLKTAAATPEIKVADCIYNSNQIIGLINEAAKSKIKLIVFPELCITGYTCQDLFFQKALIEGAKNALIKIAESTTSLDMLVVVGCPLEFKGKNYNCAVALNKGKILGAVPKIWLPNYNEFYEKRHFAEPFDVCGNIEINGNVFPVGTDLLFRCRTMPEFVLGIEICEDLWVCEPPSIRLAKAGATVIANLSASNETIGKDSYRRELVNGQSARLICGYVYASAGDGESTQDLVFGGHNIISENGAVLIESKLFENETIVTELDLQKLSSERAKNTSFITESDEMTVIDFDFSIDETPLTRYIHNTPFIPSSSAEVDKRCENILAIQSNGLKKRISHTGAKTAVIGISGGLDSCLALLVCVNTMDLLKRPHSDIVAVTMPCFGTTARTKSNAEKLCEILGVKLRTIDIADSVNQHFKDIGHDSNNHNVVFENGQARERTKILMDIANQENGLVIGTGDLSELALGWATYNGDHMSMYGVNSSVPKTLVRYIVKYYADIADNTALYDVLYDILDTPVSPELLPTVEGNMTQITEDLVGPYELHDFFLYYGIRWGFMPSKVYRLALCAFEKSYETDIIKKWINVFYKRFFSQQFKRSCLPDGPKVGSVTLSPRGDWRMPSDACSALWLSDLEKIK